ncbi:MAG TPA: DUF1549 and DUF1553 domain-containing protein [Isosphaeraceae bacterium]|jgi:hypothetical protein|nr:DUF1549 and DUF1553 domain-containing protein [Isosphaeraceae bacterium]
MRVSRTIGQCLMVVGSSAVLTTLGLAMARAGSSEPAQEPTWTQAQRQHWAFQPLQRPTVPTVKHAGWVRNPIDAFIARQLEPFGLDPTPEADRGTLIRRLRFDLTGLPPTPDEVDAFVADTRPDAYERLVDRLLDSPQYGERWGRFWLDLARYAESDGFKSDKTRPDAWRYRDWVIQALNQDMPYDRFVRLQLAGDETEPGDAQAFLATAFNRHWPFEDNNKVVGLNRQLMLEDMTDTTSAVFLGLTIGCARCHDHKYDPISQKDYYRFQALFAATTPRDDYPLGSAEEEAIEAAVAAEHKARLSRVEREVETIERPYLFELLKAKLDKLPADVRKAFETDPEERSAFQEDLLRQNAKAMSVEPKVMKAAMSEADRQLWEGRNQTMKAIQKQAPPASPVAAGMTDSGPQPPPVFLLRKGNFTLPGEEVAPGFLSVLTGSREPIHPEQPSGSSTSGRRKALADWLTRPNHPLTARVMVNRLWQQHFGRGIVATPSDFGNQGIAPSHPELLDWLATEFIARGWSMKAMHRLMVTSATYRQSSTAPAKTLEEDPDNTLFSRMFRRRLEGEAVRDALLSASGQLDLRVGGPSVFPDLPPGVETRGGWTRSSSKADRNRRSIYVFVRRNLKYPLFDAFDFPDTNVTCPERNVSVNAPQALMLLNSSLVLEQARGLAGRVLASVSDRNDAKEVVTCAYRLALSRTPDDSELKRGAAFLELQSALTSPRPTKSEDLPTPLPDGQDPAQAAALVDYCHVLLNLNEFVFVD